MPHRRLPTQGAQDGGSHSRSAGTGHPAHPSSPAHATAQCITAWRGTESHKLSQSFHPGLTATSLDQGYRKAHQERTTTSSACNHCASPPHDAGSQGACWES